MSHPRIWINNRPSRIKHPLWQIYTLSWIRRVVSIVIRHFHQYFISPVCNWNLHDIRSENQVDVNNGDNFPYGPDYNISHYPTPMSWYLRRNQPHHQRPHIRKFYSSQHNLARIGIVGVYMEKPQYWILHQANRMDHFDLLFCLFTNNGHTRLFFATYSRQNNL